MLRTQAYIGAALVAILLLGSVVGVSEWVLMPGFRQLESQQAEENRIRAVNALKENVSSLSELLYTWSNWNDLYNFMDDRNQAFQDSNFVVENFISLNMSFVSIRDKDCEPVFNVSLQEGATEFGPFPEELNQLLHPHCRFFNTIKDKDTLSQRSGVVRVGGKNYILAWRPIMHTNDMGPPNGSILFVKPISEKVQQDMNKRTRLNIALRTIGDSKNPAELKAFESKEIVDESHHMMEERSENSVAVWTLLPAFNGKPLLYQEVTMNRDLLRAGRVTTLKLLVTLSIVCLLIILSAFLALEVRILSRLKTLVLHLTNLQKGGLDLSKKAPVKGKDELDAVAKGLNGLVDHLNEVVRGVDRQAQAVQMMATQTANLVGEAKLNQGAGVNTVEALMKGILDQVQAGERAALSMEEMVQKGREASEISRSASQKSAEVQELVNRGTQEVLGVVGSVRAIHTLGGESLNRMKELDEPVRAISDFVNIISRLSEQTNLVALNAAIEAARASAEGQGFTVVADEVRKLAEESALASQNITRNIRRMEESMREAGKAVENQASEVDVVASSVGEAETAFRAIHERVTDLVKGLNEISDAIAQRESQSKIVMEAVTGAAALSEEASASSTEIHEQELDQQRSLTLISEQADRLQALAEEMRVSIQQFKFR